MIKNNNIYYGVFIQLEEDIWVKQENYFGVNNPLRFFSLFTFSCDAIEFDTCGVRGGGKLNTQSQMRDKQAISIFTRKQGGKPLHFSSV